MKVTPIKEPNNDLAEIKRRLQADYKDVAVAILGEPNIKTKAEWRWGSNNGSLALSIKGNHRGEWYDRSTDVGGDMLALIRQQKGLSFPDMLAWARSYLSMPEIERRKLKPEPEPEPDTAELVTDAARIQRARSFVAEAVAVAGTTGERYLTETRGIPKPATGWPASIMFHPRRHALLVVATTETGEINAVQLVHLAADGTKATFANRQPVKQTFGVLAGTAVRLRGAGDVTLLAEGPETGLSVWVATGCTTLVALGGIGKLQPPVGQLIIAADDDARDAPAATALAKAMSRWRGTGCDVSAVTPWSPRRYDRSDFNDLMKAEGAEAVRVGIFPPPPPPPKPRKLGPYYPAPTLGRDETLVRQRAIIGGTIRDAGQVADIQSEIKRLAAGEVARLEEDADGPLSSQRKGAITRQMKRAVLQVRGLSSMPRGAKRLITGSQGTGKTRAAIDALAQLQGDIVVWFTVPDLTKGEEVATDCRETPGFTLPVFAVRGRSATDPRTGHEQAMCPRHEMAGRLARRGVSVPIKVCPTCPLAQTCGYRKQQAAIDSVAGGKVLVLAREHLFLRAGLPAPQLIIADESIVSTAIDDILEITMLADPVSIEGLVAGLDLETSAPYLANLTINRLDHALHEPEALEAIRQDPGLNCETLSAALEAIDHDIQAAEVAIRGDMSDREIHAILDTARGRGLPRIAALIRAVLREIHQPRQTLTGVSLSPDGIVRVHRRKALRHAETMLLLDGTASPNLVRRLIPDIEHIHLPIERDAHVTGTRGRTYSRQSITGKDREGNPIQGNQTKAARLRREIISVAKATSPKTLICGSLKAVEALEEWPEADKAHFGALRGHNRWEKHQAVVQAGRESIPIWKLEDMARPFLADDAAPLVSIASIDLPPDWPWLFWPCRQTRGRRMRDGSVEIIEVEVHPDARVQDLLEQLREAESLQGIDRVRPHFNHRQIVLMTELALDVTYDRILTHSELVAGGTRWERAWAEKGVLPLGAGDLSVCFPELFPSPAVAKDALSDARANGGEMQKIYNLLQIPPIYRYRVAGRSGRASTVMVDPRRHPNPRAAVENLLGPLSLFEPVKPPNPPEPPQAPERPPATPPSSETIKMEDTPFAPADVFSIRTPTGTRHLVVDSRLGMRVEKPDGCELRCPARPPRLTGMPTGVPFTIANIPPALDGPSDAYHS